MKSRTHTWGLVLCAALALLTSSCSKNPMSPKADDPTGPPAAPPDSFPAIPRPSSPKAVIPDTSTVYSADVSVVGKPVDFAPTWSAGVFTWTIDVQTQRPGPCLACSAADPPGPYWNGTGPNSSLVFESGAVDLRSPTPFGTSYGQPHPRRLEFVQSGSVVPTPFNPEKNDVDFMYVNYPARHIAPALFGGYVIRPETPDFGETSRQAEYFVAATSCPQLTNPVFVKRERYWERVNLTSGGVSGLKSIIVDPGAQFQVTYTRTAGVNYNNSTSFTQTLNAELSAGGDLGAKLGGSLSQMFGTEVQVQAESSYAVARTFNGIDGKTVVYSVWSSVERYTFVDQNGNPYSDPNFTFTSLGSAVIRGEYEWISSTSFPYGSAAQPAAALSAGKPAKVLRATR